MFSKLKIVFAFIMLICIYSSTSFAQEHFTEGNVRVVSFYRTSPGQFDAYMEYLRTNFFPQQEEAVKQGLIVGYTILLNQPANEDDWDIAVVNIYKSFGDAYDYNQGDEDKMKAIREKFFKTTDEDKMRSMTDKRFAMRTYVGTKSFREIKLKPMN
ncbi:MAG: hypothetical protein IPM56_17290 [Ignavibacteriales bacterium]|nr:MAG: hypothetical protein IPM56_17290 [Ignavibacteriales bacterium]